MYSVIALLTSTIEGIYTFFFFVKESHLVAHIVLEDDYKKKKNMDNTIREMIDELNGKLPVFKHISDFVIEEQEFPKTSTLKIKRF